jgi:hypothetical protein
MVFLIIITQFFRHTKKCENKRIKPTKNYPNYLFRRVSPLRIPLLEIKLKLYKGQTRTIFE